MTDAPHPAMNPTAAPVAPRVESAAEEWASAAVHALAALLAIIASPLMVAQAAAHGSALRGLAVAVFGLCLVAVYTASTLMHATRPGPLNRLLLECDHIAIYLLIGGTYTPLMLFALGGPIGWAVLALVWTLSLTGIALRLRLGDGHRGLYVASYLAAGWAGLVAAEPIIHALSTPCLLMLGFGGLCYTGGVGFFLWRRLRFSHAIWHGFTLLGSAGHAAAIWYEVVALG